MAIIALNKFSGEIPAIIPSLLPENAAQIAWKCDFTSGNLAPLKQNNLIYYFPTTNPIKGLYTEDGIFFYTWTTETGAFKGPIIDDAFGRVYYLNGTTATVTTVPNSTNGVGGASTINGGPPGSSWVVGVPRPTVAPVLTVSDLTTLPDYPSAVFTFKAWYELSGTRFDEASLTAVNVTALKEWTFTPPTRSSGTDSAAVLTVEVSLKDSGKVLFTMNSTIDSATPASTSALPGGVEMSVRKNTSDYSVLLSWGVMETRAYVYTCVNTWNEESAPSDAVLISPTYVQNVTVTMTAPSFGSYRPFQGFHVYRTFGTNPSYMRLATNAASPYVDSIKTASTVTSSLISMDFTPVATGLSGFGYYINGICWAFKGNTLYFCEPYRPHAWPYAMSFSKNIRGVCAGAQSLVVTTADGCYIVNGAHSAAMTQMRLPAPQAGIATRSMVNLDGVVAFASHDGIVTVSGSQASLDASHKFFNRDDWRRIYGTQLSDASLRFSYHDGFLVGTSPAGVGFIVRTDEANSTYTVYNEAIDGAFYMPVLDTLYVTHGAEVSEFRASPFSYVYTWQSKDFVFQKPTNLAVGYIRSDGNILVNIYADGVLFYSTNVNNSYFRIPGGRKAIRWSVQFVSSSQIYEAYLASSMTELKSV